MVNQEQQHFKKRWLFSGQRVTKRQLEVSSRTPSLGDKAAKPYTIPQFILLSKTHWFPYIQKKNHSAGANASPVAHSHAVLPLLNFLPTN